MFERGSPGLSIQEQFELFTRQYTHTHTYTFIHSYKEWTQVKTKHERDILGGIEQIKIINNRRQIHPNGSKQKNEKRAFKECFQSYEFGLFYVQSAHIFLSSLSLFEFDFIEETNGNVLVLLLHDRKVSSANRTVDARKRLSNERKKDRERERKKMKNRLEQWWR